MPFPLRIAPTLALAAFALAATGAAGQGLLDRLQEGARQATDTLQRGVDQGGRLLQEGAEQGGALLERGARRMEETIEGTVDLATNEATPEETRAELDAMEIGTLARLFVEQPAARDLLSQSAGYAVFDRRQATLLGLTAGFGRGVAVDRESGARTYMNMGTGGVGVAFGLGGFATQAVILFERSADFEAFVTTGIDATAEGGTMIGDERATTGIRFVNGRQVFVLSDKGWKVSGTIAGTRYWPAPGLN
jgi:hypothetical protein